MGCAGPQASGTTSIANTQRRRLPVMLSFLFFFSCRFQALCSMLFAPVVYFLSGFSSSNNGWNFFTFMIIGVNTSRYLTSALAQISQAFRVHSMFQPEVNPIKKN